MKTEIRLNSRRTEPLAIIETPAVTDEVHKAAGLLASLETRRLCAIQDGRAKLLDPDSVSRLWADGEDVYVQTQNGTWRLKLRLYEAEARLDPSRFVRISRSEIINLDHAESFDMSLAGTVEVRMKDGHRSYVARRSVKKIREVLGI